MIFLVLVVLANAGIYKEAKEEVQEMLGKAILNEKPCEKKTPQNTTNTKFEKLTVDLKMEDIREKMRNTKVIVEAEKQTTLSMVTNGYRKCKYNVTISEKKQVAPCKKFLNDYKNKQPKWMSKIDKTLADYPKDLTKLTPQQKAELAQKLMDEKSFNEKVSFKKLIEKL
ncbi:hypothetical protein EIN_096820 [Entamoeba invadens IP1]|uniref:Uncharacterized protein n=1 Tax=Entamoeba invadens IP1 TaxID=370355 RepID=A0A0A1U0K0_ENTIV|nr:hypothetical protein EIN_096820 [Entamoeba invadens IP1]ELP87415.1 hypothetical protein EIN_096820 [Entamoeba invadens IP1]|eukprot:XP_004254186.1 hypothetical protein EIN_096820 [Entamoeba invadens IP1]